mmetsp:Transcript_93105/g.268911  ORF Transcript_93105/g.268911 Transcript_93105/m.268911 type:complete len:101 (-) Transcript_93105:596-898(-)
MGCVCQQNAILGLFQATIRLSKIVFQIRYLSLERLGLILKNLLRFEFQFPLSDLHRMARFLFCLESVFLNRFQLRRQTIVLLLKHFELRSLHLNQSLRLF